MFDFLKQLTDPQSIIHYGGLWLLLFVVFAETGLLVGFFLPGDSLIFISGLLCATKPDLLNISLIELLILLMLAAIIGNVFGYWFGKRAGSSLYNRKDSFFFRKSHLKAAEEFYLKYGTKTLIIGRFLPVIRTFAPIVAGAINMTFPKFMFANILGAAAWVGSLVTIGYFLGTVWPEAEHYLGYIIILLVVITAIPVVRTFLNQKKNKPTSNA